MEVVTEISLLATVIKNKFWSNSLLAAVMKNFFLYSNLLMSLARTENEQ